MHNNHILIQVSKLVLIPKYQLDIEVKNKCQIVENLFSKELVYIDIDIVKYQQFNLHDM